MASKLSKLKEMRPPIPRGPTFRQKKTFFKENRGYLGSTSLSMGKPLGQKSGSKLIQGGIRSRLGLRKGSGYRV